MISISIPVYNYNTVELINSLHKKCLDSKIDFEINLLEDGSDKNFYEQNIKLNCLSNVNHIIIEKNIGRAAARNKLVELAKYEKILFIDCDSMPFKENYIEDYIKESQNHTIVCGGTTYVKSQLEKGKELRFFYGQKREVVKANIRNINPNQAFTTNNFIIEKRVIEKIKFKESLKTYGHEDTLLGYELLKNGLVIKHIDNPVIHLGIEKNKVFIQKTETSIENLVKIKNNNIADKDFFDNIKLCRIFFRLKKFRIDFMVNFMFFLFQKTFKSYLIKSKKPKLLIFDLYKLGLFADKLKNSKEL